MTDRGSALPNPEIVETPDTLDGDPRIKGTRIGVDHILDFSERGYDVESIATEVYPHLSLSHVQAAVRWAENHPERIAEIRSEKAEAKRKHDLLQSAVDNAVEASIQSLKSVLSQANSTDDVEVRPVASILRNGFEQSDELDIDVDPDEQRVVITVRG